MNAGEKVEAASPSLLDSLSAIILRFIASNLKFYSTAGQSLLVLFLVHGAAVVLVPDLRKQDFQWN